MSWSWRHVKHSVHSVDLLLDGDADGLCHRLRIGSGIYGTDLHGGWCDVRILGNGQDAQCDQSCYDDEQRQYGSKDRTVYEEF